jgi:hypothetical protein
VIFRNDFDHDCQELPEDEWRVVSVLTVAAPCFPELTEDLEFAHASDLEDLRDKIRLVYRMAAVNGNQYLVVGESHPPHKPSRLHSYPYWTRGHGMWSFFMSPGGRVERDEKYTVGR